MVQLYQFELKVAKRRLHNMNITNWIPAPPSGKGQVSPSFLACLCDSRRKTRQQAKARRGSRNDSCRLKRKRPLLFYFFASVLNVDFAHRHVGVQGLGLEGFVLSDVK